MRPRPGRAARKPAGMKSAWARLARPVLGLFRLVLARSRRPDDRQPRCQPAQLAARSPENAWARLARPVLGLLVPRRGRCPHDHPTVPNSSASAPAGVGPPIGTSTTSSSDRTPLARMLPRGICRTVPCSKAVTRGGEGNWTQSPDGLPDQG
jgi:hypothetical protein